MGRVPTAAAVLVTLMASYAPPRNVRAAEPTSAATTPAADVEGDKAAVIAKGKRYNIAAYALVGGSLAMTTSTFVFNAQQQYNAAIVTGSAGLAMALTGLGFAVAGMRRVRHPEKFMRKHQVAIAPNAHRHGGGVSMTLRF